MRRKKVVIPAEKPKGKRITVQEGPVFNHYNKESIYAHLRRGLHIKHAAMLTGLSERTVAHWLEVGKVDQLQFEDGDLEEQTEKAEFYAQCNIAMAEFFAKSVDQIRESGDWNGIKFLMVTGDREQYGPEKKITLDQNKTSKMVLEIVDSATWKKDVLIEEVKSSIQITDGNVLEAEFNEEEGTEDEL